MVMRKRHRSRAAGRRIVAASDATRPTFVSGILAADGQTLTLVFSEPMKQPGAGFNVQGSFFGAATSYVSGAGTDTLVFSGAVYTTGENLILSYTPGNAADLNGNTLAAFTGRPITNNSVQP